MMNWGVEVRLLIYGDVKLFFSYCLGFFSVLCDGVRAIWNKKISMDHLAKVDCLETAESILSVFADVFTCLLFL